MKKLFISVVAVVAAVIICGARIYKINTTGIHQKETYYGLNEEVPLECDFTNSSKESHNGYSVTVTGTELLSLDELKNNYKTEDKRIDYYLDHVYLVKIKVKNTSNKDAEKAGIDTNKFQLQSGAFMQFVDDKIYPEINDPALTSFSLKENTEMDFILPFAISQEQIDIDTFKNSMNQIVLTLYPNKKIVKLDPVN